VLCLYRELDFVQLCVVVQQVINSLVTIVMDCVNIDIVNAFAAFKSDESILCGFCSGYDRATCMRIPPKSLNC